MSEPRKYECLVYVQWICELQRTIDDMVKRNPELKGVVPTFHHDPNPIGPSLVDGKTPVFDPKIYIRWEIATGCTEPTEIGI